jgi:hypothetical protein
MTSATGAQEGQPYAPLFRDPVGVFDEGQQVTLARDADLLQSTRIPIVVTVRVATADEASPQRAQAAAATLRAEYGVESAPGADDGLLLLYSHVPGNPGQSTIVASWGAHTFDGSGLTAQYVVETLARDPRALLDEGHPFEALVYAMRQIRYGGIYFPPPPPALEGAQNAAHTIANIGGPVLAIVTAFSFIAISSRVPSNRMMERRDLMRILAVTLGTVALVWMLSVYGQSRIGIASALAILLVLGLQAWLWTHPSRRQQRPGTRCSVPSTARRILKRAQARRLHHGMEGRA